MSKLEFKQSDFEYLSEIEMARAPSDLLLRNLNELIAKRANHRLAEMLASATVVYKGKGMMCPERWTDNMPIEKRTHKALLINIEEIKRRLCKHEPKMRWLVIERKWEPSCKHCGVELVAEWKIK